MAKVIGPLMSVSASMTLGKTLVFQAGRNSTNIVRMYKIPANPRTLLQLAQRQKMAAGGKAIKTVSGESAGAVFLRTKVQNEGTYATVISSNVISIFDEVKDYMTNPANASVVSAFSAAAATQGTEPVRKFAETLPEFSAAGVLIALYMVFSLEQHPTLTHNLTNLVAGDAAALIGIIKK